MREFPERLRTAWYRLIEGRVTEQLDALLPPPGGVTRSMAGLMKLSL